MPLFATSSPPQSHSNPDGIVFEMTDAGGTTARVLVTRLALHDRLDNYVKPQDQFSGAEIFEKHRERIEQAASKKFDAKGLNQTLDGQPTLFVQSMDL